MKRILVVFGTRPEAIKMAPVILALRERDDVSVTVCSTGQHREMLDNTLRSFDLQSNIDLGLMQPGQSPTDFLGRLLLALRGTLSEQRPDTVVVQGDTTTVMGAALAGFMAGARVAHVEAGLRTQDKRAPFPEEVNRRVAGVVADDHFAPTERAADALIAEGVSPSEVYVTGNTVVDALRWMSARVQGRPLPDDLVPTGARLVLVTAHRRESFGEPFRDLCLALRDIAQRHKDVCLVYPVHLNPNVQQPVNEILGGAARIKLIPPQDYATLVALLTRAHLVLTDSGGIQEEAPSLGKPVLVLREKTERPEAVAAGVVKLVGTDRARIVEEAGKLLSDESIYRAMAKPVDLYGDGRAAKRIAEVLATGMLRTPEFKPKQV